jgi:hypothetical protein
MDTPLAVTPLDCISDLLDASVSRGLLDAGSNPDDKQRNRWCNEHDMESLRTLDIRRYHGICLAGLGKATNCFSPDGRSWGPNRTPGYQATEVPTL